MVEASDAGERVAGWKHRAGSLMLHPALKVIAEARQRAPLAEFDQAILKSSSTLGDGLAGDPEPLCQSAVRDRRPYRVDRLSEYRLAQVVRVETGEVVEHLVEVVVGYGNGGGESDGAKPEDGLRCFSINRRRRDCCEQAPRSVCEKPEQVDYWSGRSDLVAGNRQSQLVFVPLEFGESVGLVAAPLGAELPIGALEILAELGVGGVKTPEEWEAVTESLFWWRGFVHLVPLLISCRARS